MEWKGVSEFLSRARALLLKSTAGPAEVASVLKEVVGIDVEREDIAIKNSTVFITTSSVVRSEIYLKKALILNRLRERGVTVADIR